MKCNICNRKIKKCIYGNPNCKIKRHWECNRHCTNFGLGYFDPCYTIDQIKEKAYEKGYKYALGISMSKFYEQGKEDIKQQIIKEVREKLMIALKSSENLNIIQKERHSNSYIHLACHIKSLLKNLEDK